MRATHTVLAILLGLTLAPHAAAGDGIAWQLNLEAAKRRAAETNRPVLIHFWAPSCAPCVRMDSEVFPQPAVAHAINSNFIPVKLNTDDFPATASLYGVDRIPTDVILNPAGQPIHRAKSPLVADQFVAHVTQAVRGGPMSPVQLAAAPSAEQAAAGTVPINTVNQNVPTAGGQLAPHTVNAAAPPASGANLAAPGATWPQPAQQVAAPQQAVQQPTGQQPQPQFQPIERQHIAFSPNAHAVKVAGSPQNSAVQQITPWVSASTPNLQQAQSPPVGSAYGPQAAAANPAQQFATPLNGPVINNSNATPGQQPLASGAAGIAPQPAPFMIPAREAPPIGLEGFCPVTLAEQKKWNRGDVRYGVEHRGRTYLFCTPENQKRFFESPDRYSPVMCGMDPVLQLEARQTAPGRRDLGVFYQSRVYLFATIESKAAFEKQPQKYAAEVLAAETATGRVLR